MFCSYKSAWQVKNCQSCFFFMRCFRLRTPKGRPCRFTSSRNTKKLQKFAGCFLKWWYPQIIHFNRVFHYKPSILGYPYFWKHPADKSQSLRRFAFHEIIFPKRFIIFSQVIHIISREFILGHFL